MVLSPPCGMVTCDFVDFVLATYGLVLSPPCGMVTDYGSLSFGNIRNSSKPTVWDGDHPSLHLHNVN